MLRGFREKPWGRGWIKASLQIVLCLIYPNFASALHSAGKLQAAILTTYSVFMRLFGDRHTVGAMCFTNLVNVQN